jgi:uncharacterized protein YbjT (DUF2867 family)
VSASEVLVTGGAGVLGRRVAERLSSAGDKARVLSRSGRSGTIRGDLLTGEGLDLAVRDIDVIVHCASSLTKTRQTDVEGTERLLEAAGRAGVSHFVFITIVGVDRNPYFPYYRMKLEVERIVERSPVPWTILRATQFHELVLRILRFLERLPIVPVPRRFLLQPIDVGEVADRLVKLAFADPAGRVPDVGGPEVRTMAELARAYLGATGCRRKVLEVPPPGKFFRAAREGAMVCPEGAYGKIRWEDFLRERLGSS